MTFAHPYALLLGLLAIAVVVLYWLRTRTRREPVATGMFWQQVFAEERFRERWRPWRHKVSLGLQLLLLVLLVIALAGPQIPPPRQIVLIVDNGASMNATDVSPNRLEAARETAQRLIAAMREGDEMALLASGGSPAVLSGLTADQDVLQTAVASLAGGNGPSEMKATVELASEMLRSSPTRGRIVALSDGCFDGATEMLAGGKVELPRVGTRPSNSAITRLVARRTTVDALVCQILVEVRHFSDQPGTGRIVLTTGGRDVKPIADEHLQLKPDETWQKVFEVKMPTAGQIAARLEATDAYPADNEAVAEVPVVGAASRAAPELDTTIASGSGHPGTAQWSVVGRTYDLRAPGGLGIEAESLAATPPGPALWLYVGAMAMVLFIVEWSLYQRRWTV